MPVETFTIDWFQQMLANMRALSAQLDISAQHVHVEPAHITLIGSADPASQITADLGILG